MDLLNNSYMDALDDFTLRLIIDQLPLKEKINVERVSKRWKAAALKSARQMKYLHLDLEFKNVDLTVENVKEILWRCGENLTDLHLTRSNLTPKQLLPLINRFCKNLENLCFDELKNQNIELNLLSSKVAKNLKQVRCRECSIDKLKSVASFLKKAVKLDIFAINNIYTTFLDVYGLRCLSKTIKSLDVSGSLMNDMHLLKSCLEGLPNLRELNVSFTKITSVPLVNVSRQLKVIKVSSTHLIEFDHDYRNISLPQVEELHFGEGTYLKDYDFFDFLSEIPKLKKLSLQGFEGIEDEDGGNYFKLLARLPHLELLDVTQTSLTDEVIEYWMSNNFKFKQIRYRYSYKVTKLGLLRMIESLPDLEYIEPSIRRLGDVVEILNKALTLVQLRKNCVPITIEFEGGNQIDKFIEEFKSQMKRRCDAFNILINGDIKIEFILKKDERSYDGPVYTHIIKFIPCKKLCKKLINF